MSLVIAGLWELGHNVPLQESYLWEMVVRDFAVDEWHMSPVTGIQPDIHVCEWHHPEEMLDALREHYQLVFVTEGANTVELRNYQHPENACYVFGKCNWSPFISLAQPVDDAVHVATTKNKGLLWPHQCAATVLWHRGNQ